MQATDDFTAGPSYNKVVFPQMSRWLPDDERDQLCFEFSREMERIEQLMAA